MNGEPEQYLRSKRFMKNTKGLKILLLEWAVPEIDARRAVRMAREETAREIFKELETIGVDMKKVKLKENFSPEFIADIFIHNKNFKSLKAKFLQEKR